MCLVVVGGGGVVGLVVRWMADPWAVCWCGQVEVQWSA